MPAGWVAAAGAAVSAGESIESNQAQASATKANNAANAGLTAAQGSMLNQAESVAQQPYQAYTGTLTAPMSANEQQGNTLASQTASNGVAQQDNSAATGLAGQEAANGWNANTEAEYANPYTSAVTNQAVTAANKSYLQNLAQVQSGEAGSGSFGNGRTAIEEGELAGQNQLNIGNITTTDNANSYNAALNAWQADNSRMSQAAGNYEAAGQDLTNMTSDQISDLMKTGGVAQGIAQTDLNNQYNQFMRQQNWSATQLGSLISAVGADKGSPAQTAAVQSNTANQLLGLGSTVAGLYGGSSSGSNTSWSDSGAQTALNQEASGGSLYSGLDAATAGAGSDVNVAYSDYGLKKNVEPLYFDGMSKLPVVAFHYLGQADHEEKWVGFIAQDVADIYPEAVSYGPRGFMIVDHEKIPGQPDFPAREGVELARAA